MESEGLPKPSLRSRIKERLKKVFHKEDAPLVPEGAGHQAEPKKSKMRGAVASLEDQVIQQQTMESVLKSLTSRERQVYDLLFVEGKTNAEAARELGVTDEAVRQRRVAIEAKARSKFRK